MITGESRERRGLTLVQVSFPNSVAFVPEDQLEVLGGNGVDVLRDLGEGRFASCDDLQRTLTHVRLTGRLADLIYSIETTDTTFYAYQFKPVVKLLQSPSTGILIADEVGLGKTIEAGLIWTELRSRFDYRRLFVLCPAVLREKWKRELARRFGVSAEVLNAGEVLQRFREHLSEGGSSPLAVIASIQGLRPPSGWDDSEERGGPAADLARLLQLRESEEPLIDLLVVDEAHYLRNPETKSSQLGRLLRKVSTHAVLLSATPVHLRSQDLFQLLHLVDEDMFRRVEDFDHVLEANRPLVQARDLAMSGKADAAALVRLLREAERHSLLHGNRQLGALLNELSASPPLRDLTYLGELAYRLELVNLLGFAVTRTRKRDVVESRVVREPRAESVPLSEPERMFYEKVTGAVRTFCSMRPGIEGFLLVMPQRQMSSCMPAALRHWQSLAGLDPELAFEDLGVEVNGSSTSIGPLVQELTAKASGFGDWRTLRDNDSKYERLRARVRELLTTSPKEKVVLFSYFRPTLAYLRERLYEDGISSIILQGGDDDKDATIRRFAEPDGPSVLLSSEIGSEGIDLQFSWIVINYDLPWNPMRVEQRIGRVDRIGQQSPKVVIWNLFYEETIDARIYERLYRRLRIFEQSLGALEPILGDQFRTLTLDLLTSRLTAEQERDRIDQTALALENARLQEEKLEQDAAQLVAHGDYILNQVKAARELSRRITGTDIRRYVLGFLTARYPGTEIQESAQGEAVVSLALGAQARFDLAEFLRNRRAVGTTRLALADPRPVLCRFENVAVHRAGDGVEYISQLHPLVRFVADGVQQIVQGARPAVAISIGSAGVLRPVSTGVYVFAVQRWSFSALQDQEKLFYVAAPFAAPDEMLADEDAEALVMAAVKEGIDWNDALDHVDLERAASIANHVCMAAADDAYRRFAENLNAQNEDRADIQERGLDNQLKTQTELLGRIRDRHAAAGRIGLARATEARLANLAERVKQQRLRIGAHRNARSSHDEVAVGLIRVEG